MLLNDFYNMLSWLKIALFQQGLCSKQLFWVPASVFLWLESHQRYVNINARRVTFVYFFTQLYFRQIRRIISLVWQLLCYASGYKQVNVCWVLSKTIQSTYIFLHNTSLYVHNKAPILTLNILLFQGSEIYLKNGF